MSATRTHRSAEEWDALALEVAPLLRDGHKIADIKDRIGSNVDALHTALARQGLDPHGEPLAIKELTASRPGTLAKRVAARRRDKAPWWMLKAETGKSYGELTRLLREYGYTNSGEESVDGAGQNGGHSDDPDEG